MAIAVSCSGCEAKYKVADDVAGKKVRCKSCGATMLVPTATASSVVKAPAKGQIRTEKPAEKPARPRPAAELETRNGPRRPRADDEDVQRPSRKPVQKKSGSKMALILALVAGGGALLLCLGVGGVAFVLLGKNQPDVRPSAKEAIAQATGKQTAAKKETAAEKPSKRETGADNSPKKETGADNNPPKKETTDKGVDPVPPFKVPDPPRTIAWDVQADPRPALNPVPLSSIALKAKAREILGIYFGPAMAQWAVFHADLMPGQPRRQLKIDLHDNTGKYVKTFDLYQSLVHGLNSEQPAAISPDGTKLVFRDPDGRKRLELRSLADGSKISEWTPHGDTEVTELFFLDNQRVLANARGQVSLWNVGENNNKIYSLSGYQGILQVSPGKQYFVVCTGTTLELMDSATGKRKGQLIVPGHGALKELHAAAFSHDGKELAAVVSTVLGKRLARWNLATGDTLDQFPTTNTRPALRWLDQRFLLHDDPGMRTTFLIDGKLRGPLMEYAIPAEGQALPNPPDDRFWYWFETKGNSFVAAMNLPDGQGQGLADQVAAGQVQPAMAPGSAVHLEIETNNDNLREEISKYVAEGLPGRGFHSGKGGITVKLTALGQQTGKTLILQIRTVGKFGQPKGFPEKVNIQDYKVDCEVQIHDPQGALVYQWKNTYTLGQGINLKSNEYQREIEESIWSGAKLWSRINVFPNNLFRIGGQTQALPKRANLPIDP